MFVYGWSVLELRFGVLSLSFYPIDCSKSRDRLFSPVAWIYVVIRDGLASYAVDDWFDSCVISSLTIDN